MSRDNRVKPCRRCRKEWGITHLTRSDAACDLHHSVGPCAIHGGIDCDGTRDGCPGSYTARVKQAAAGSCTQQHTPAGGTRQ